MCITWSRLLVGERGAYDRRICCYVDDMTSRDAGMLLTNTVGLGSPSGNVLEQGLLKGGFASLQRKWKECYTACKNGPFTTLKLQEVINTRVSRSMLSVPTSSNTLCKLFSPLNPLVLEKISAWLLAILKHFQVVKNLKQSFMSDKNQLCAIDIISHSNETPVLGSSSLFWVWK